MLLIRGSLRANIDETDPVCLIRDQGGKENRNEQASDKWFALGPRGRVEELIDHLYSLERFPSRCPFARAAKRIRRPIRCLSFGKPRNVYRILFEVGKSSKTVWILHIRHCALSDLRPEDAGKRFQKQSP